MRERATYVGVDLLRFIAALMVMAYHLGYKGWSLDHYFIREQLGSPPVLWEWSTATWPGWVGVQIFFVISGFVIAFSSESATPYVFFKGRLTRLAPVMWVCATICLGIALYWQALPPVAAAFLFLKSITFFPIGPWIAGQIWTLPVEIMFYGLILVLLLTNSFRRVGLVSFVLSTISAAYWIAIESGWYVENSGRLTQLLLLQHGCYFALGVALWMFTRRGVNLLAATIVLVSLAPTWIQIRATLVAEAPGYGFESLPIVPFLVWGTAIIFMAGSIYWNDALNKLFSSSKGTISMLGRLTYPLYLVHYHIGGLAMISAFRAGFSPPLSILFAFMVSVATAYAIAAWMERPVASLLSAWTERFAAAAKRRTAM